MPAINQATLVRALLVVSLAAGLGAAKAQSFTNVPVLAAELRSEAGPGQLKAERAYLSAGAEKFSLLVPTGFLARSGDPSRLMLITTNLDRVFTLRLVQRAGTGGPAETTEGCRSLILSAHPYAKITQEFSRVGDGRRGPAFDANWIEPGGVGRSARIIFVPSRENVLEFAMVCSPEKFTAGCQALNTILATFRASDENGHLHISPLSDRL